MNKCVGNAPELLDVLEVGARDQAIFSFFYSFERFRKR